MNCRLRLDLLGLGLPGTPSPDFCDGLPSRPVPELFPGLPPATAGFWPFGLWGSLPPLPPQAPLVLPTPFRAPERWTGLLNRRDSGVPSVPTLSLDPRPRPTFSAADLMRPLDSMLRGALEAATPPPPASALTAGLSPDESPWVGVIIHLLGRLLASADIRIAGVPANARADGLISRPLPEGGGEEFLPGGDPYRCRYTEFRENHHFAERIRDGERYQPSCIDPDFSHRPECSPGERYICMAPETHTTVRIQVREVEDRAESIVSHMAFQYDHHPHVLAERIPLLRDIPGIESLPALLLRGFFGNDPAGTHGPCRSNLDETVCEGRLGPTPLGSTVPPPALPYFLLQYSFEDPTPHPLPESVDRAREATSLPYSSGGLAPTVPLLEFSFERGLERSPIQQLVTTVTRAFGQEMLEGWLEDFGLNRREEARYRELGIPVGALPRSVANFLSLVRPLFTEDTHDRLERQANTWNPNVVLDQSPLFLWSATREVEVNGLLRAGSLDIPDGPRIELYGRSGLREAIRSARAALPTPASPEEEEQRLNRRDVEFQEAWIRGRTPTSFNRLEIRADESELSASLSGAALPELRMPLSPTPSGESASLSLRRVLADRVTVSLPPLYDLFNANPIDPRPLHAISLENPYLSSLELHYGTISLTLRNVRAERMEYRLPSPREIRERHLTPDQYWTHGHWTVRGLRADSLRVENPRYDLSVEMRNLNGEIEGRRDSSSSDTASIPFFITRLGAESIRASMGALGSVTAENTELNDLDFSLGLTHAGVSARRIFSRASMEYRGTGESSATQIRLSGETTLNALNFRMDFPEEGPLQGRVDFGLTAALGAGTLDLGPSGTVRLTRGSLQNGSFHSEFTIPREEGGERRHLNRLEGDLMVEVERVEHFRSHLNIPGFSFDGSLENFILNGPTRITYGHDRWAIERREGASTPLSFEATLRETRVGHDPRVTDSRLRRIPRSEVVRTEATLHRARLRIDDFVRWSSLPPSSPSAGSEGNRLEVDFRGLRVTEISSSGELWAALPPWRYLRGLLAVGGATIPLQRGRPIRPLPPGGDCSALPGGIPAGIGASDNFIYLGGWRTVSGEGTGTESALQDLRACLLSEPVDTSGSRPFVVLGVPELGIHRGRRPAVTSGDAPIHLDACVLDLARGGWVCLTPAPRDR